MVTLHSKMLVSSTKPAENPSTGFLQRSATKGEGRSEQRNQNNRQRERGFDGLEYTFELLLKEKACLRRHQQQARERGLIESRASEIVVNKQERTLKPHTTLGLFVLWYIETHVTQIKLKQIDRYSRQQYIYRRRDRYAKEIERKNDQHNSMRICEFPIRAVRCGLVLPGPGGASSGFDSLRPYLFVSDAPLFIQSVPRQRHSRFSCHPQVTLVQRLFGVQISVSAVGPSLFCFALLGVEAHT